ncbi:MAG TPA: endonuclease [Trebonia sp.]|nr:endonuclease [Trebonia sp.]
MIDSNRVVWELLENYGQTYSEEAGIKLADKPSPLYQLHVLSTLLSARISANVAVAAARELFAAGYRTPAAMTGSSWQDRVDALGRGHYRRYDERTARMLGDAADMIASDWNGDLRQLRDQAEGDPGRIADMLTGFPGIGPAGADIFLREVQAAWPSVAPYADKRVAAGAQRLGLPADQDKVAGLLADSGRPAELAAALVRVSRVRQAPGTSDKDSA